MTTLISPSMAVHRHRQDTPTNCGRACVQTVISAVTQNGPDTEKVPVTQDALFQRELEKECVPASDATPIWFTHPDELVELLRTAPEWSPAIRKQWRLANHETLSGLLDDLVKALERGTPSVMVIGTSDHWVVFVGAEVGPNGLEAVHYHDPGDAGPLPQQHTYVDDCSIGFDGVCCAPAERLTVYQFGTLEVAIDSTPSPAGMTHYEGRFVAVVHGPSLLQRLLDRLLGRSRPKLAIAPLSRRPTSPELAHPAVAELAWRAREWTVPALEPLLASRPELVDVLVHDLDGSNATYRLVALWSESLGYGLVGVFESDTYTLEHLRFTSRPDHFRTLRQAQDQGNDLWMTRRWLPSLRSPYHPFARQPSPLTGGPVREAAMFTRLIDGFVLNIESRDRARS